MRICKAKKEKRNTLTFGMVGVEVPLERAKIYAAEQRRRRYVKAVMTELDISITSLDVITNSEQEVMNGEEVLPTLSVDFEEELLEQIEREELHKAIKKLTKEERILIIALFFDGHTEREWSRITGIPQRTINDRKRKIIEKLKKFLGI